MNQGRGLVDFCMDAATASSESVEKWRRQRRTLERMPSHLANALFRNLHCRGLLFPSILEIFQHCVDEVELTGESRVNAEWMVYLGAFHYLRSLTIADCKNVDNSSLWPLSGHCNLKELDMSRCSKITNAGIKHLLSITTLEKLRLSETGLTADGVQHLSSFVNLRVLDLGGIPVTDKALSSLQGLARLEYLDLWGSEISDIGSVVFEKFPMLSSLNIAWTKITILFRLSISCLNMSNCTIHSIAEKDCSAASPLSKLIFTGTHFNDYDKVFSILRSCCLNYLDISYSNIASFDFLVNFQNLEHLDLTNSLVEDGLMEQVASAGKRLRYLNLSYTKITSYALSVLAGRIPKLENLSLSHTLVDDASLVYISMAVSLQVIDLSHTSIRGFVGSGREQSDELFSLSALQNLTYLRSFNLENTNVLDEALQPLSLFTDLNCLYLKGNFLTDYLLQALAPLKKLRFLGFRDGVLSDHGLLSYMPPPLLCVFDLRGCWLLSATAISSFCKAYKQIEVRHEHACNTFGNRTVTSDSSATFIATKLPQSMTKTVISSKTPISNLSFVDERIKYSSEELLHLENEHGLSCMLIDLNMVPDVLRRK